MFEKNGENAAYITRLSSVRKHVNADRLQIATVMGDTVIVGLDAKEGDKVVYFDSNLCLNSDFCSFMNMYQESSLNNDVTKKGYINSKARVKAVSLRGEKSYGLVIGVSSIVEYLNSHGIKINDSDMKEGESFNSIYGINICNRYVVAKPVNAPKINNSDKKTKVKVVNFPEHWDTKQFKRNMHIIPVGATIYIEEKFHGTSQRTGNVNITRNPSITEKIAKFFGAKIDKYDEQAVNGTRRTVRYKVGENPDYRDEIFLRIKDHLKVGEQVYYEIYGYESQGKMIQKNFPYGCEPGTYKTMLYRMTVNMPDGKVYDMGREYVYKMAEKIGMEKPHVFEKFIFDGDYDKLLEKVEGYTDGKSTIDKNTIREGVVIWFEGNDGTWTCLKNKSFDFINAESRDDFIDVEDES